MLDTPVTFFYGGMDYSGKKREKQIDGLAYLQNPGRDAAGPRIWRK